MKEIQHKTELEALTHEVKKLNKNFSWHTSLIRGMVTGFGTAIGAGFLVAIVAVILERLTIVPIFGQAFTFFVDSLVGK